MEDRQISHKEEFQVILVDGCALTVVLLQCGLPIATFLQ